MSERKRSKLIRGRKLQDITGLRFHRLLAIRCLADPPKLNGHWDCICDCGNSTTSWGYNLVGGKARSCGCLQRESASATAKLMHARQQIEKGGRNAVDHPLYGVHAAMLGRCRNPNNSRWADYGGCGITVCSRWCGRDGFTNFLKDMGEKPSPRHSIDRYPNPHGNYEPSNCRWATPEEQQRNRRRNVRLTFRGRTQTATEWAQELGINKSTLYHRIRRGGWNAQDALWAAPLPHNQRRVSKFRKSLEVS